MKEAIYNVCQLRHPPYRVTLVPDYAIRLIHEARQKKLNGFFKKHKR